MPHARSLARLELNCVSFVVGMAASSSLPRDEFIEVQERARDRDPGGPLG
jgi:hypothetical protein